MKTLFIVAAAIALAGCAAYPASPVPVDPVRPPGSAASGAYRALGNEPFWSLDIGTNQIVFNEANAPGTPVVQPTPRPIIGFAGEIYQTPRINVNIVHARCSDGMSDRVYPDRVQLTVDGRRFEGCGGGAVVPTSLAGTNWRVAEVGGMPIPQGEDYFMRFEASDVSAKFGCNSMGGSYRYDGQTLVAGPLMATRMACAEMRHENAAGRILASPLTATWNGGDRVTFSNALGAIVLERSY